MKQLVVLGSTGSIGRQTLEVVDMFPEEFHVVGLATNTSIKTLQEQVDKYEPEVVSVGDKDLAAGFKSRNKGTRVLVNDLKSLVLYGNIIVNGMVGGAGLEPTYTALVQGKDVALANKEPLVIAGDLLTKLSGRIIPMDSEHAAVAELLRGKDINLLERIVLPCSGGPFYNREVDLDTVTPEMVTAHPTWQMGDKISVDSATLVNKAFEIIEAHHLFGLPYETISMMIHPKGLIHAKIKYDGTWLAYFAPPDMKLPISQALFHPKPSPHQPDPNFAQTIEWWEPNTTRFLGFEYILEAGKAGGDAPAAACGANDAAVASFLRGEILFSMIPGVIEHVMGQHDTKHVPTVDQRRCVYDRSKRLAQEYMQNM